MRSVVPLLVAAAALPALIALAGCNGDQSRGTTASEPTAESPEQAPKPEALNPESSGSKPSDVQGVPLKAAQTNDSKANPPYLGIWAANPDWCKNPTGSNVPIQVTEKAFKGYENDCAFAGLTPQGNETWEAQLSCTGEGQQSQRRITLRVAGNRMDVVYHDLDDQTVSYTRCVPAQEQD